MEIFKLVGSIFVDSDAADKSLSKTDKKAEGVGAKLGAMGKTAFKAGGILAAGLGAAVTGAVALGKQVGDTADRLLDLNSITGMSTDEIQKWQNASVIAGTSAEAMTMASEKLTQTMDTMASGTGKAAEAADALGFSYDDLSGMDADQRMNEMITALQGVEDKTERAKMGTDLFGKKWAEIAPIVDLGVQGLKEAKDNATVFDEDSLVAANNFRIALDSAKKGLGDVALQIGISLMPMLETMGNYLTEHMPQIKAVITKVFDVIGTGISTAVSWIGTLIDWVKQWKDNNSADIDAMGEKYKAYFESIVNMIQAFVSWAVEFWEKYGEDITAILSEMWDVIVAVFDTAITIITDIFNVFAALFSGDWEALWEGVKKLVGDIFTGVIRIIGESLDFIFTAAIRIFSAILSGIKNKMTGIKNAIVNGMEAAANYIISLPKKAYRWGADFIQGLIDGLKSQIRRVKDTVKGLADTISSYLHFSTPDVGPLSEYESWMPDFMEGLAEGIEKNKSKVIDAVNGLAMNMDMNIGSTLTPAIAGASRSSSESTVVNFADIFRGVTFYVRSDDDVKKIAKELYNLQSSTGRAKGVK